MKQLVCQYGPRCLRFSLSRRRFAIAVILHEFSATEGLTGLNAAVAVAGVCGYGWLRFLAVLKNLYDWFCG